MRKRLSFAAVLKLPFNFIYNNKLILETSELIDVRDVQEIQKKLYELILLNVRDVQEIGISSKISFAWSGNCSDSVPDICETMYWARVRIV